VAAPRRTFPAVLALAIAGLAAATGASAQSLTDQQATLDGKISSLRTKISYAKNKEGILSSQISSATDEISSLEGDIDSLSSQLTVLQADLAEHRARLAVLEEKFDRQTRHLKQLRRDHEKAQRILDQRLVELYETGEVDSVAILLQVENLTELIQQIDFMNDVGEHDQRLAATIKKLKIDLAHARRETAAIRTEVAEATSVIEAKAAEAEAAQAALVARQSSLAAAKESKTALLADVEGARHEAEEDLDSMLAASATLADQIRAAQTPAPTSGGSGGGSPSAAGFIWPVNGTVTSGFGMRWGRMHEGIDIAAPTGTAIHAAAGGTVIYAGVMSGYGNIVVIDHGGGISTAYGHMSAIWVGGGTVSQGQGIGAVGCTGHCTGPHVHFEVRVNGSPVDPMGYL
jgi:murein DD-endopeptidase MepM/ murein hydrolase activator NlpD